MSTRLTLNGDKEDPEIFWTDGVLLPDGRFHVCTFKRKDAEAMAKDFGWRRVREEIRQGQKRLRLFAETGQTRVQ